MTEKLTLEIAMKYPKAFIQMFYNGKKTMFYENLFAFLRYDLNFKIEIQKCKLQLRPLSGLTKSECSEILSIMNIEKDLDWKVSEVIELIKYRTMSFEVGKKLTDKLREWNIDFETPSLQERGIAVYE